MTTSLKDGALVSIDGSTATRDKDRFFSLYVETGGMMSRKKFFEEVSRDIRLCIAFKPKGDTYASYIMYNYDGRVITVERFATAEKHRRKGYAFALIGMVHDMVDEQNDVKAVITEIPLSNAPALYAMRKCGIKPRRLNPPMFKGSEETVMFIWDEDGNKRFENMVTDQEKGMET